MIKYHYQKLIETSENEDQAFQDNQSETPKFIKKLEYKFQQKFDKILEAVKKI